MRSRRAHARERARARNAHARTHTHTHTHPHAQHTQFPLREPTATLPGLFEGPKEVRPEHGNRRLKA
eukprot:8534648-Alexandrium_andersonii.AAC.1